MHERNLFIKQPNYTDLAIKYKEFRRVCKLEIDGRVTVEYKNQEALSTLSKILLKEYFELDVEFAPGSLIPTIPMRLNYILWVEDLVAKLKVDEVTGIDIGCGSSCVYSLLAAKRNWQMIALESNAVNVSFAQKNIQTNNLQHLIEVFQQPSTNAIFENFFNAVQSNKRYTFCMCNPPFYDSNVNKNITQRSSYRPPPRNCSTGYAEELACPGGEVEFVTRIIKESILYKNRIMIFTSMLGHKSSVIKIVDILNDSNIINMTTTEFRQGNTTRWYVAWTFLENLLVDLTIK